MSEPKVATVVITVDLKCCDSARKIKCAVCQLEMCYKINSIVFDENKSTVTVSGPFDPYCFVCKLRCMAGDVIKDVVIKSDPPPETKPVCGCGKQVCGKPAVLWSVSGLPQPDVAVLVPGWLRPLGLGQLPLRPLWQLPLLHNRVLQRIRSFSFLRLLQVLQVIYILLCLIPRN
ncbi:uncharacterized protein LOC141848512 [Curcuma longa]|uniref:uncharacterized protein LOC141848512 n=1 Tax=Curcuma longa TaxID=136217 RepID=UPI003D9EB9EA